MKKIILLIPFLVTLFACEENIAQNPAPLPNGVYIGRTTVPSTGVRDGVLYYNEAQDSLFLWTNGVWHALALQKDVGEGGGASSFAELEGEPEDNEALDTALGLKADASSLSSYLPLAGGTMTGQLTTRDVLPNIDDNRDLGSSALRFRNIYAMSFRSRIGEETTLLANSSGINIKSVDGTRNWYIYNNNGYLESPGDSAKISIYPDDEFIIDRSINYNYSSPGWQIGNSKIITAANASSNGVQTTIGAGDIGTTELADESVTTAKLEPSETNGQVLTTVAGEVAWATSSGGSGLTAADIGATNKTLEQSDFGKFNYTDDTLFLIVDNTISTSSKAIFQPTGVANGLIFHPASGVNFIGNGTEKIDGPFFVDENNVGNIFKLASNLYSISGYVKPYSISTVTGVIASNLEETSFDLDWDAGTVSFGAISDYQYRIDGGTPVGVTASTATTVTGLSDDTEYDVEVRAVDDNGNLGGWSTAIQVTTSGGSDIAALAPIYDFNAESLSLGALTNWFNEGDGTGTVATQATSSNRPTVVDESGNKAVQFDGTNDILNLDAYTDLTAMVPGTSNFTFITVIGSDGRTTGSVFGDRDASDRSFNFGMTSNTTTLLQIGTTGQQFETVPSGSFIFSALVTGTTADIYVDTTQVRTNSGDSIGGADGNNSWHIGARSSGIYFNGSIRRVLWFDYVLSPSELADVIAELQAVNQ